MEGIGYCRIFDRAKVLRLNPHYSCALLLQSPIRYCDKPAGGGLVPRAFDVLHEYASGPQASVRRSRDAAPRFRDELS
jgi:hypothetical protein